MRVAVRTLCEFSARAGDLDHRFTPAPSAVEGIAGHARVVARRGAGYQAELPLQGEYCGLTVQGRADGYDPTRNRLEEIKTHRGDLSRVSEGQRLLHWAQLKVYGALLCREQALPSLELALVYFDVGEGRETCLTESASAEQLQSFFARQCDAYLAWARQEQAHRGHRDLALESLRFPFSEFRSGQRELAETVYKAVSRGRHLLLQAPTGIGKTIGTLFPCLAAMPRRTLDRLFFLTARTTGRQLALDGLQAIIAAQVEKPPLRVLELVAREKACEHPDKACNGESCPLARGFYDRLPGARQQAVVQNIIWCRDSVRTIAQAHGICPYYLSQELARWSDVVVGDVNHYFDFYAMLHGLSQANDWRVSVLVDEAHNLIGRARNMYSVELEQQHWLQVRQQAPESLKQPLARVTRAWSEMIREAGLSQQGRRQEPAVRMLMTLPVSMLGALQNYVSAVTDYLTHHAGHPALQETLFAALAFCRLAESFGEHSICELKRSGRGRAVLAIRNLIPADFLAARFANSHSTVLFSATLSPADYYRDLLGLPPETPWQETDSPFVGGQLDIQLATNISTRLNDRAASLPLLVDVMAEQYRKRPGHYLAFFSSFAYLETALERFQLCCPDIPVWSQTRGMREEARQDFLQRFSPGGEGIGFAVLGGAFAEGIDLPGDRLIGAFIATLGLPPFDRLNEQLRARLQQRFGRGYDYAYLYPGLQKVVQAAGRVIRTPEDRGVLVLMDERFGQPQVRSWLPGWWMVEPGEKK